MHIAVDLKEKDFGTLAMEAQNRNTSLDTAAKELLVEALVKALYQAGEIRTIPLRKLA